MIYTIYLNDEILFYPNDDKYAVNNAVLKETINEASVLEFDIFPANPKYNDFSVGNSYVHVERDGYEVFFGKVTEIDTDITPKKHIYVRGVLAELYEALPNRVDIGSTSDLSGTVKLSPWEDHFAILKGKTGLKLVFDCKEIDGIAYKFYKKDINNGKIYQSKGFTTISTIIVDSPFCWLGIFNSDGIEPGTNPSGIYIKCDSWEFTDEASELIWTEVADVPIAGSYISKKINPCQLSTDFIPPARYIFLLAPSSFLYFGDNVQLGYGGNVQYSGKKDYLTEYKEKYVEKYELYMKVVKDINNDNPYAQHTYSVIVSTLDDYGKQSNQFVEYGRNLISFNKKEFYETVVNAVIPWAKDPDGSDIELSIGGCSADTYHINSADNFIENWDSIKKYGRIEVAQEFNDVLDKNDLLRKAEDWLIKYGSPEIQISATAFDMSAIDKTVNPFEVGDKVVVKKENLDLDEDLIVPVVSKVTYINDLTKNQISLGTSFKAYTQQISNAFSIKTV